MARLGTIPMLDAGPAFTLTDVSLVTSTFVGSRGLRTPCSGFPYRLIGISSAGLDRPTDECVRASVPYDSKA